MQNGKSKQHQKSTQESVNCSPSNKNFLTQIWGVKPKKLTHKNEAVESVGELFCCFLSFSVEAIIKTRPITKNTIKIIITIEIRDE
jgi:hypothetical protein